MAHAEHQDLVLQRTIEAPVDLVWKAWTDPDHLRKWWAPKPYETIECDIDLRPGGAFCTRMIGPDGFDEPATGCFLEIIPNQKIVWTSALGPEYRPVAPENCGGLSFTAIVTFEAEGGRTRYKAVAMHKDEADRDMHEKMGFHEGWGTVAGQLERVARELGETV